MKKKKELYPYFFVAVMTVFLFGVMAYFYMDYLDHQISEELMVNINEISEKNKTMMQNRIEDNLILADSLAQQLQNETLDKPKQMVDQLEGLVEINHFKRIGIATLEGDCYTTDGAHVNISSRSYFQKAIKGESNVSEVMYDLITTGTQINAYAAPIYQNGNIQGVLFFVKSLKEFQDNLLVDSFNEQGFSILANQQGKIILQNDEHTILQGVDDLAELEYAGNPNFFNQEESSGIIEFRHGEVECYLSFEALGYNEWYVVTIVPTSVVSTRISSFSQVAFLTWFIIIIMAVTFFIVFYYFHQRNQHKMEKVLFTDALTGHDNFNKFKLEVSQLLETTASRRDKFCLIEFDICDFKMFNKIYGYANGDDLLITIMYGVKLYLKDGEQAARISEDRFAIFLEDHEKDAITSRISKIYAEIQNDFTRHHPGCKFSMQFGVYRLEEFDYDLMKCLDKAIYAKNDIKKDRKQFISFYSDDMYEQLLKEKQIEERMQSALDNGEFIVYLQPKVEIETKKVVAAEALVRWKDPYKGLISPGQFIPIFEKNGFLEVLDMYVLDTVLSYMASWKKKYAPISVSVNLSRTYIFQEGFAKRIYDMAMLHEVDTAYVELEITESTMLDDPDKLIALVKELKSYGFLVSMDDFGSGYSSLNMLKEIPIDIIKLDQVFLQSDEQTKERSKLIIEGIMDLINLLGMDSVAEGVETKEQLELLYQVHCHVAQGFYFYRPMPASEFEKLL